MGKRYTKEERCEALKLADEIGARQRRPGGWGSTWTRCTAGVAGKKSARRL